MDFWEIIDLLLASYDWPRTQLGEIVYGMSSPPPKA